MPADLTSKEGRYHRVAYKAGLCCSVFSILFFIGIYLFLMVKDRYPELPRWSGIVPGTGFLGAFISGVVCISAHLIGKRRRKSEGVSHDTA